MPPDSAKVWEFMNKQITAANKLGIGIFNVIALLFRK
jgi:hypothetical protein